MFPRELQLPENSNFFLFGARGTGKSTLLRQKFGIQNCLNFDLLNLDLEMSLARDPMNLAKQVLALPPAISHVILDDVQKLPKLLDVVHYLVESQKVPQVFVLTGSSARKLKRGGANLLAGRAALRYLFPFLAVELKSRFDVQQALQWGTLPGVWFAPNNNARKDALVAYANTYLKEEIWSEQVVKQLDPFRKFTQEAGHHNGKILNFSSIGRDAGVDFKTVQNWYQVLEDTLVGFFLDAFHTSVRQQIRVAPKFYFYDVGVARALALMLSVVPGPGTSYYGDLFEQLVISQIKATNHNRDNDYTMSYLMTKSGMKVDLVLERPGKPLALIEIKSKSEVTEQDALNLRHFEKDFPQAEFFLFSLDPIPKRLGKVKAMHWQEGLESGI